jgi:hypothetical protein
MVHDGSGIIAQTQAVDLGEEVADVFIFVHRQQARVVFVVAVFPAFHILRAVDVGGVTHADGGGKWSATF